MVTCSCVAPRSLGIGRSVGSEGEDSFGCVELGTDGRRACGVGEEAVGNVVCC